MKRYTQVECDVKDISSFILFIGGSLFLAPFRLFSTLGKKVIFLPKEILNKILTISIGLNILTMLITLISLVSSDKDFSILKGQVPILIYFLSLIILIGIYLTFTISKPKQLDIREEHVPSKKKDDFTLYDEEDPLLKFMEQSDEETEEEEYLEKLTKDNLKSVLQEDKPSNLVTEKLNQMVQQDEFGLSEIKIDTTEAIQEQEEIQDSVLEMDIELLEPETTEAIYASNTNMVDDYLVDDGTPPF